MMSMLSATTGTENIASAAAGVTEIAETIRVYGIVQGVGFRPMVWTLAHTHGLKGWVSNTGQGVCIHAQGDEAAINGLIAGLRESAPPLARIERITRQRTEPLQLDDFVIQSSIAGHSIQTHIPPDAATCQACLDDIHNPSGPRYHYPFTNCTHCGPRLSIIQNIPYDRPATTMAGFTLCADCQAEYDNPADRRFHAQPNACPVCGPQLWLESTTHESASGHEAGDMPDTDPIHAAAQLLKQGKIVAIKGIGGFHLAVDAGNEAAIIRLRKRKQRPDKPFALMARDLAQIEQYCQVTGGDIECLSGAEAPIVLLQRRHDCRLSSELAPRQRTLGFMLPYSPLHHLLMQQLDNPLVLTSGNLSSEPQCIDNDQARRQLGQIADAFLMHNRPIANRIDDSVVRLMAGQQRVLRRARGYAPTPLSMPESFKHAPAILAMGSELKNTFCLSNGSQAILSQHMGDLENYGTYEDYRHNLALYQTLYRHKPEVIVVDKHPEYLSSKLGRQWAEQQQIPLLEAAHHHAHIAACMAENHLPLHSRPVLGIALDGLGYGDDGTLWGGEFLLADYVQCQRLAHFTPIPLPGATQAMREPWRNTYANLHHYGLWETFRQTRPENEVLNFIAGQPLATLNAMLEGKLNSPAASSCGRLFDAVAACLGICQPQLSYEGQAAIELEALLPEQRIPDNTEPYPFAWEMVNGRSQICLQISSKPMWQALFHDLDNALPTAVIAARFHLGLANVIIDLARQLLEQYQLTQVALSGGVFQNRVLFELVVNGLQPYSEVLTHQRVPANDGGLALGQWAIAAATCLQGEK
ncbi:MAG: carbamoyltransferase HypF [Thiolinea sp.]